ncbi:DUF1559 domain-containing protein [Rhodopirellula sp. MGV]|uniref:DUF1559 domain-containing protein n=1 Tax=Rhodopirellula sp. MGV TaxID=2023130 RepID=UPI000B976608|nr:DUF1559 domain-containing protein [Rhodopirellula sp. MGV]OYP34895.1 hypothetical protein CGZ80_12730 [Rhodopirellula sp. MGV]PNY38209.1 DUF1559 domain-containing protein [Rhodopirellula baltica]
MNHDSNRLTNVLILVVCGLVLFALLPKHLLSRRMAARSGHCVGNLREIALALHNYSNNFKQLPPGTGGTWSGTDPSKSNQGRLGPLVGLLPFLGKTNLWEMITNPFEAGDGRTFPAMGPTPTYSPNSYLPWSMAPEVYLCPASAGLVYGEPAVIHSLKVAQRSLTVTSYVASFGDATTMQGEVLDVSDALLRDLGERRAAASRGMFMTGKAIRLTDCTDGLSNTVMYSETVASLRRIEGQSEVIRDVSGLSHQPSLCLEAAESDEKQFWKFGRGARWSDGWPLLTGFQTVLPPNSPSCTSQFGAIDPIVSAASLHPGGVHVGLADGATLFIANEIDTGDLERPGVASGEKYCLPNSESPYGLWGAIGSRAASESVPNGLPDTPVVRPASVFDSDVDPAVNASIWTDNQTNDQLLADLLEIRDNTTVRLRHPSGVIHEVPLNSLIPLDILRAVEADLRVKAKATDQSPPED